MPAGMPTRRICRMSRALGASALDQPAVRCHRPQAVHPQGAVRLLQQIQHHRAGNGAGYKACQRRAHDPHAEAVDQHRVAADVHHVHHQTGQHTDLAVALRPEQCRTGVVQANEGVAQRRKQKVGLGVAHHVRINGAKDAPQNGVPPADDHRRHQHTETGQHEQYLRSRRFGVFRLLMADVLAGDHRTAGRQCAHDLDHQGVEAVHKAHAGHGGFAHRGHHQGISQTNGHA